MISEKMMWRAGNATPYGYKRKAELVNPKFIVVYDGKAVYKFYVKIGTNTYVVETLMGAIDGHPFHKYPCFLHKVVKDKFERIQADKKIYCLSSHVMDLKEFLSYKFYKNSGILAFFSYFNLFPSGLEGSERFGY